MPRQGLTPERVAAAAVAVADTHGLEAITVKRVADDLGVRPPSLYNHVASRDELVRAVAVHAVDELADAMNEAVLGRSGDEALVAAAHAYRAYAHAHPARAAATLRAPRPGDEAHLAAGRRAERILLAALRGRELAATDEVHAVRAFRAAVVGFIALEAAGGFAMPVDADASFDVLVSTMIGGLSAALQTQGGRADDH